MNEKISREVENINSQRQQLNSIETYVLRLMVHGYSNFEIIDFLEIELDQFFKIIDDIRFKFGYASWYKIIIESFQLGIIRHEDFIDDIVKQQAILFSKEITSKWLEDDTGETQIKNLIIEFYNQCNKELKQNYKEDFTINESEYLKLKFKGLSDDLIRRKLQLVSEGMDDFREGVLLKLKTNNWYNSYKKAFQMEILNKLNYLSIDIDIETLYIAVNFISVSLIKSLTEKEKQLLVYNGLLRLYAIIEFNYLSKASL